MEHFFPWKTQWPNDDAIADGQNQQQQLIRGMLNKTNLLNILRTSTLFMDTDGGARIKVVCRYQQFRAANKIIDRLRKGRNALEKSGVVWHTQGSGKSLTMVFVARMLRASKDLNDYKILLISACTNKPFFEKYHAIFMEYFLNFNSAPQKNHQFLRIA